VTPQNARSSVGYSGLRELPLRELLDELDRVERRLAHQSGAPPGGAVSRDLTTEALRNRERAVVAEIRRRPGGDRLRWSRTLEPAAPPG